MEEVPAINPPSLPLTGSTPISLCRVARIPPAGKDTQIVFTSPNGKLVFVGLPAGHEWKDHSTPNHAIAQIVSGECEFHLEGRTEVLRAGNLLYMTPRLSHSVTARQETVILLTLVNSASG